MKATFDSISLETKKTTFDPLIDNTPIIEKLTQVGREATIINPSAISNDCER